MTDRVLLARLCEGPASGASLARELGIKATIVLPSSVPKIKLDATRALGAEIVLSGPTSPERIAFNGAVIALPNGSITVDALTKDGPRWASRGRTRHRSGRSAAPRRSRPRSAAVGCRSACRPTSQAGSFVR